MSKRRAAAAALAITILAAAPHPADSATGSLNVQVTVMESSCTVGAASLNFGVFTSSQSVDLKKDGSITYSQCPTGAITFALDGGGTSDARGRALVGPGGAKLFYQLYRDSARTQIWATGGDALTATVPKKGNGSLTVYGTIPGGQSALAGSYGDTIGITVTF